MMPLCRISLLESLCKFLLGCVGRDWWLAKPQENCWPPCVTKTVPVRKTNVGEWGAGDSWGRDYLLGNTTHSSTGTKTCLFLSRYLGKAGSMAMPRSDFCSNCRGAL